MVEAGQGGELTTEGVLVLHCSGRHKLLQREVVTGPMPILDEPDTTGSSLTKDAFHPIAVAGGAVWRHGRIVRQIAPLRNVKSPELSRLQDIEQGVPILGCKLLDINGYV